MQEYLLRAAILLIVLTSFGCASSGVVATQSDDAVMKEAVKLEKETVKLECKSPHRQGCRYQGLILPWNDWAAALGYSKEKYAVIQRQPSGSAVIVTVESR